MDIWGEAASNWSDLCVAMGCKKARVPGAFVHFYNIRKSGTFYNFSLVHDPSIFSIDRVEKEFVRRDLPFAIKIPGLTSHVRMESLLRERGYSLVPVWNLMTHKTHTGKRNPDVQVEEISWSRLEDWFALSNLARLPQGSRNARQEMVRKAMRNDCTRLLLATLDGKLVGEGLLFVKDRIASIHMMATVPEFRRRHVATTIVLEAIEKARETGVDLLWLRTRKGGIGERVYLKCGFDSFSEIRTYSKTPELEEVGGVPP